MKNLFVPYEQALHLKELGFNEGCFGYYVLTETRDYKNGLEIRNEIELNTLNGYRVNDDESQTTAPLYQQAFRWFREKHGLYHFIGLDVMNMSSLDDINKFAFKTAIFNSKMDGYDAGNYKSFEEAELACIKKLIQIV